MDRFAALHSSYRSVTQHHNIDCYGYYASRRLLLLHQLHVARQLCCHWSTFFRYRAQLYDDTAGVTFHWHRTWLEEGYSSSGPGWATRLHCCNSRPSYAALISSLLHHNTFVLLDKTKIFFNFINLLHLLSCPPCKNKINLWHSWPDCLCHQQ